jgi:hypothetical protein
MGFGFAPSPTWTPPSWRNSLLGPDKGWLTLPEWGQVPLQGRMGNGHNHDCKDIRPPAVWVGRGKTNRRQL